MTSPFLEYLNDKSLPGFALLKNTQIAQVPRQGARIVGFDEAHWSQSIADLRAMFPKPLLLQTREAKEQASYKFSEEQLKNGDFSFEDLPISLTNESSDRELFGESYTIFWCVPADKEAVISLLIAELSSDETTEITGEMLKKLWDEKVNRIFLHYTGEVDVLAHGLLQDELHEELIEAINALPNAPSEDAWDALNEDVFWGDDEY